MKRCTFEALLILDCFTLAYLSALHTCTPSPAPTTHAQSTSKCLWRHAATLLSRAGKRNLCMPLRPWDSVWREPGEHSLPTCPVPPWDRVGSAVVCMLQNCGLTLAFQEAFQNEALQRLSADVTAVSWLRGEEFYAPFPKLCIAGHEILRMGHKFLTPHLHHCQMPVRSALHHAAREWEAAHFPGAPPAHVEVTAAEPGASHTPGDTSTGTSTGFAELTKAGVQLQLPYVHLLFKNPGHHEPNIWESSWCHAHSTRTV